MYVRGWSRPIFPLFELASKTNSRFCPPPLPRNDRAKLRLRWSLQIFRSFGACLPHVSSSHIVSFTQQTSLCYAAISRSEAIHLVLVAEMQRPDCGVIAQWFWNSGTSFIMDLCNLLQSTRRHIPQDPPRESQIYYLNICLDARSRN